MTKKSSAWMPFYVGDYLADTMHLTTVQHGAYFLLICHYWRTGPIVDDDGVLASICRMGKSEWTKNRAIIRRFFTARDGLLHQKRIDAELEFASGISEKRRAAANASWANRESKPSANAHANAPDLHLQNGMQNGAHAYMRDARQSQSQSQSESQREVSKGVQGEIAIPPSVADAPPPAKRSGRRAPKRSGPIPEDWLPSEDCDEYAEKRIDPNSIGDEVDKFVQWHTTHGSRHVSWELAWKNWIDKAAEIAADKEARRQRSMRQ